MPELDLAAIKDQIFGTNDQPPIQAPEKTDTITAPAADATATTDVVPPLVPSTADAPKEEFEYVDPDAFIKAELNFDNWNALKQWIEDKRKAEQTPATPAEIQFANEQSKKIYENLRAGKVKEVKAYLDAQEHLSGVEAMNDEQKLKLYIKMQNPLFDSELIDDEFYSLYKIDEEKYKDPDTEVVDQVRLRKDRVRLLQRMENDVKKANEYFSEYQTKIELADIEKAAPVDEGYATWQQNRQKAIQNHQVVADSISKVAEVSQPFKFNDEASKLSVEGKFSFTKEMVDKAKSAAVSYVDYLNQYFDKDGNPLSENLVRDIAIVQNLDALLTEAIREAVMTERRRSLSTQKNIGDGVQRNLGVLDVSEIQRMKEQIFG